MLLALVLAFAAWGGAHAQLDRCAFVGERDLCPVTRVFLPSAAAAVLADRGVTFNRFGVTFVNGRPVPPEPIPVLAEISPVYWSEEE